MKLTAAVAVISGYFAVASYLKYSYVPRPDPPSNRIWLNGPFIRFGSSGTAYVAATPFDQLADSVDDKNTLQSRYMKTNVL
jgi:hypothetical protein